MNKRTFSKRHIAENILLALKGAFVGFGAIMPGISGGTLCVAFGMYQPLIEVFFPPQASPAKALAFPLRLSIRRRYRLHRPVGPRRMAAGAKQPGSHLRLHRTYCRHHSGALAGCGTEREASFRVFRYGGRFYPHAEPFAALPADRRRFSSSGFLGLPVLRRDVGVSFIVPD